MDHNTNIGILEHPSGSVFQCYTTQTNILFLSKFNECAIQCRIPELPNAMYKGLFIISRKGGGVVLFGKSARKKRVPPPWSHRKILVPPPRSRCQKWVPPTSRVPEAYQGSRGESRERGIQGGGGIARKGYFALFRFFFCVCKKWIPPSAPLQNIHTPPLVTCSIDWCKQIKVSHIKRECTENELMKQI